MVEPAIANTFLQRKESFLFILFLIFLNLNLVLVLVLDYFFLKRLLRHLHPSMFCMAPLCIFHWFKMPLVLIAPTFTIQVAS